MTPSSPLRGPAAIASVLILSSQLGCGGGNAAPPPDDPATGERAAAADPKRAEVPAAPAGAEEAAPFAQFPADSEFVFGVSVASLRESALWDAYGEGLFALLGTFEQGLPAIRAACEVDPAEAIARVFVAGTSRDADGITFAIEGMSRDDLDVCGERLGEREGIEFAVSHEGDVSHYRAEGESLWLGWYGDRSFVTGPRAALDGEWSARRARGQDGLAGTEGLAHLIEDRIDADAGLWFAAVPAADSTLQRDLANLAEIAELKSVYGSLTATERLSFEAGLELGSAVGATAFADELKMALGMLKGTVDAKLGAMIESIEVTTADVRVAFELELGRADIEHILGLLGPLFGTGWFDVEPPGAGR